MAVATRDRGRFSVVFRSAGWGVQTKTTCVAGVVGTVVVGGGGGSFGTNWAPPKALAMAWIEHRATGWGAICFDAKRVIAGLTIDARHFL